MVRFQTALVSCAAVARLLLHSPPVGAQELAGAGAPDSASGSRIVPVSWIGGAAEDRLRLDQILGRGSTDGFLIRSASARLLARDEAEPGLSFSLLAPEVRAVWNGGLPFSFNDGALWAGRGLNLAAVAGVRARIGRLAIVLAPEAVYAENSPFQTIPYPEGGQAERSPFASSFHAPPESLDLPSRFGADPVSRLYAGQSSLSLHTGPLAVGVATENLWWGPGIRNAIVMSGHAPGIPHVFLRAAGPLRTPLGELSGRWILGGLRESRYFDDDPDNDWRTLSALALTLRPALEPDLTLGFARAVVATYEPGETPLLAPFDAFQNVGRPNSAAPADPPAEADQVFSLFARWIFPDAGFEAYGEWARFEQPISFRDLLVAPNHSQGYTLGLQWARPTASSIVRLQGELTYLEPSATFRQRPLVSTYASRVVEQGYTNQGQIIGAGIGPGASSQWLAIDYLHPRLQAGAFAGRIRWEEQVHETVIPIPNILNHDVSVFGGVRGGFLLAGARVTASFTTGVRFNYLFQNPLISLEEPEGVDVRFSSIALTLGPGGF